MPLYIQRSGKGPEPIWIAECTCCKRGLRRSTFDDLCFTWPGVAGNYNGQWEFICQTCLDEARTGVHVVRETKNPSEEKNDDRKSSTTDLSKVPK